MFLMFYHVYYCSNSDYHPGPLIFRYLGYTGEIRYISTGREQVKRTNGPSGRPDQFFGFSRDQSNKNDLKK